MTKKNKKHVLTQKIMEYVSNGNEFNISEFRKNNASDYAKIILDQ